MKKQLVRSIVLLFVVLISLTLVGSAKNRCICSLAGVQGEWGYTETGTIILPTGPVPFVAIGSVSVDANGAFTGTQESSTGGAPATERLDGSVTVDPECTGTITVGVHDQSGNLLRTVVIAVVYVDSESQFRGVVKSLTVPSGASLPSVITLSAERTFSRLLPWWNCR